MNTLNPVDFMIRRLGISRAEVTARHELGKNLLLKACQGRVHSITPRIASVLWKEWSQRGIDQDEFDEKYNTLDLDLAYQRWRRASRRARRGSVPEKVVNDTKLSPFQRVVNAIGGESRAAKLLMVPDIPLTQYASGKQKPMPLSIREALDDLGYPYIENLERAQNVWQEKRHAR